jgi:dTDP-4-dehydrorhamnose reductase
MLRRPNAQRDRMIDCLVTGAGGALGSVLLRVLNEQHRHAYGLVSMAGPTPDVGRVLRGDVTDPRTFRDKLLALSPRVVMHLAAVSKTSEALRDPELARSVNVDATQALVELGKEIGARFVYVSTDMVFDGERTREQLPFYTEQDTTEPGTYYGRLKLEGECYALAAKRSLVVRLPLLYGLPEVSREPTFFENMLHALKTETPIKLFEDEFRTPLWLDDAALALCAAADSELTGVLHVSGPQRLSRLDMGRELAAAIGCSDAPLVAARRSDLAGSEPRPHDLSLDCARYLAHFGAHPGRAMCNSLPLLLARGPHRLLS